MSDNIPFDIQMDIMNRLPVKSLLQFRVVSKQWKFSIDNFEFIHENLAFRHMDSNLNIMSFTPVASSESVRVREFSPPYYISQLGDSVIISGSFDFRNFCFIYEWALEVEGGFLSSCSLLFTIPPLGGHYLKLLGFNKDIQPIVEATIVQAMGNASLQSSSNQSYFKLGVEANRIRFSLAHSKSH
ncbi:F-box domain containing protein [Tanacetum coccineum]|uniref:F-box domain containing protein n=1 Tax=Tanacetum coccineum TaxID=301880 RepID=A0ABQ4Z6M0_9ASTR